MGSNNDGSVIKMGQAAIGSIEQDIAGAIKELRDRHEQNQKAVADRTNDWTTSPSEGAAAYKARDAQIVKLIDDVHTAALAFGQAVRQGGEDGVNTDRRVASNF